MNQTTLFPQQESQNESKTENLVRKHFEKYDTEIKIEEKISDSPRIQKLLKSASKSGSGKGYPDYIAVIECKPNIQRHDCIIHNQYKDYVVDGTLFYTLHLCKI